MTSVTHTTMLTLKKVNSAIAHTGLRVEHEINNNGCMALVDIQRDSVVESVYVKRLNHLSLEGWVDAAESAQSQN